MCRRNKDLFHQKHTTPRASPAIDSVRQISTKGDPVTVPAVTCRLFLQFPDERPIGDPVFREKFGAGRLHAFSGESIRKSDHGHGSAVSLLFVAEGVQEAPDIAFPVCSAFVFRQIKKPVPVPRYRRTLRRQMVRVRDEDGPVIRWFDPSA